MLIRVKENNTVSVVIGKEFDASRTFIELKDVSIDLSELGSLFVTGLAGSGKTTILHRIISSILQANKTDLQLVLAENFLCEFSVYENQNSVQQPIIDNAIDFIKTLKAAVVELQSRLQYPDKTYGNYILIVDKFDDFVEQVRYSGNLLENIYSSLYQLITQGKLVNMFVILSSGASKGVFNDQLQSVMQNRIVCLAETKGQENDSIIKETLGATQDYSFMSANDMLAYFRTENRIIPIKALKS
ncbi:MAG: NACHT domain-containing protein [Bacteroidales bacterium]|nr:NACHT domain-containing protein [Bacteroidales bacterium]